MTIINTMLNDFRKAENYQIESIMGEQGYTEEEKKKFAQLAEKYKNKGNEVLNWLIKEIGISKKYLENLLQKEVYNIKRKWGLQCISKNGHGLKVRNVLFVESKGLFFGLLNIDNMLYATAENAILVLK